MYEHAFGKGLIAYTFRSESVASVITHTSCSPP